MKITSSAFEHGGNIPAKYTCDGENVSPPLKISNIPAGTKSLVLIVDDPDAPGGTWDHWVVFNMPPNVEVVDEGEEPTGIRGKGSRDNLRYNGPCPPDREHRYFFKLYALDSSLELQEGADKKAVEAAMEGHILAETEMIGLYNRPENK